MSVRVVVADDNLITRAGIVQLLEPDFEVVATCGDLPEVLHAVDRTKPDVVLTDIRMPPSHSDEGIRLANRLRETHPEVAVIVLSQYEEPVFALSLAVIVARIPSSSLRCPLPFPFPLAPAAPSSSSSAGIQRAGSLGLVFAGVGGPTSSNRSRS